MPIPRERLLPLMERMLWMRRLEEEICRLGSAEIFGNYHLYIGQEATGAAVLDHLVAEDHLFSTHRNHAHAIGRGIAPEAILAELMLRETGTSQGKGGTQHVMSRELNFVTTSIVGGSTILATGAALAAQIRGDDSVGVAFLGDRSVQEGAVSEALNLASLWELPVLYVCENNDAFPFNPRRFGTSLREVGDLARAYGIRAEAVDATDPQAAFEAAEDLVRYVRAGRRPAFLETRTMAYPGRAGPSLDVTGPTDLRLAWEPPSPDPLEAWHRADPVLRMAQEVLREEAADAKELLMLDEVVQAGIASATRAARAAAFPPAEAAFRHLRAEGNLWPS
jgi:pyruvate dehydrogenase E1 component alpha subunit